MSTNDLDNTEVSDFRKTRLWCTTLAPQRRDPFEEPRARLRGALEVFREHAATLAGEISIDLRDLTVHDITHIDALWETADLIAGESLTLSPTEAFVLGGAFLVHDLGMGLAAYPGGLADLRNKPEWGDSVIASTRAMFGREPNPHEVVNPPAEILDEVKFRLLRALHAGRAENLVNTSWVQVDSGEQFHLLEDSELRSAFAALIGQIAHSHWWPVGELPRHFPTAKIGPPVGVPNEWNLDAVKLALLLRLADAAHLDGRRAPAVLRKNPIWVRNDWISVRRLQDVQGLYPAFRLRS